MQHFSLTNIRNPSAESKIVPKNANSNIPRFFLDLLKEWNGNFFKKRRFISIFCKKSYVTFSEKNISFADTFMHLSYASNSKIIDSPVLWGKHLVFNNLIRAFGKLEKGQKGWKGHSSLVILGRLDMFHGFLNVYARRGRWYFQDRHLIGR